MAQPPIHRVLAHLRGMVRAPGDAALADGDLLRQFAERNDEAAFVQLMDRHGDLVWGVCQRVLGQVQDAEDAYQATFLVLARQAAAIAKKDSVRGWLHGVAYRIAKNARRAAAVRRKREGRTEPRPPEDASEELTWKEVRQVLDEEMARLPEKYRLPLLLCYLEGKTQDEAARELGWGQGVFRGRLDRGRERLHRRLSRRGLGLSAGLSAILLTQGVSRAAVPAALRTATMEALTLSAAGTISAPVAVLMEGTLRTMFLAKIKLAAGVVLSLAVLVAGAGWAAQQAGGGKREETPQTTGPEGPAKTPDPSKPQKPQTRLMDFYGDPLPPGALARLGTLRLRHGGTDTFVTYSPDGRFLASWDCHNGFNSHKIRLWDAQTGRPLLTSSLIEGNTIAFSPDGKLLATATVDPTQQKCQVVLWQTETGQEVRRLTATANASIDKAPGFAGTPVRIRTLAFSPDGKTLAAGGDHPELSLWETATGKEIRRIPGAKGIELVAFEPDGRTLISIGLGDGVRWWDVQTGKPRRQLLQTELAELQGRAGRGTLIALSPDRQVLAWIGNAQVAGQPGVVRQWNLTANKELTPLRHPNSIQGIAFSPDGKMLATSGWGASGSSCKIRFWNPATGQKIRQTSDTVNPYTMSLAFSPNGKRLASSGNESAVRLWEVANGKEVIPAVGHRSGVSHLAFLADDKRAITAGYESDLRVWDAATGKPLECSALYPPNYSGSVGVRALAISPDGQTLGLWTGENVIRLLDARTGKEIRRWKGHSGGDRPRRTKGLLAPVFAPRGLTFSPDGKYLAVGSFDGTVPVWETATGKEHQVLRPMDGIISLVAFSPDGKYLAAVFGTNRVVLLVDVSTGKQVHAWKSEAVSGDVIYGLAFSPDGKTLAAGRGRELHLWSLASGKRLLQVPGKEDVNSVAFSPDGRILAACSGGTLRLWETATNAECQQFVDPSGRTSSVTFSLDGQRIGTISGEGTVLLWDIRRFRRVKQPGKLADRDLQTFWSTLAGDGTKKVHDAIVDLADAPHQAIPFLQERLLSPLPDPKRLAQLIADLNSEQFPVRQKAEQELEKIGEAAESVLRQTLAADKPSLEVRRRVEQLLEKLETLTPQRLQQARAIQVLERADTPEAKKLLETLAQSTQRSRLAREAKMSLDRLNKRAG